MTQHEENSAILPAEEIIQAFRDLACCTQNALGVSADLAQQQPLIPSLLDTVLTICQAQRGACLLHLPSVTTSRQHRTLSDRTYTSSPLLDEREMAALQATSASTLTDVQVLEEHPTYLIWLCPLVLTTSIGDKGSSVGEYPLVASFLISWDHDPQITWQKERARRLLQQVEEGIRSALMTLVLSERARELEAIVQNRSLQQMDLLKAELLASVSHELRSPLSSIQGYTSTLLRHDRQISREERLEFLQAIAQAGQRLERVVGRLLELSLHETGNIVLQVAPVHLIHLVREAIIAAESRLQQEHTTFPRWITFRLTFSTGEQEPIIQADRRRLREVLDQLLENALLYSPEGGEIEIGIRMPTTGQQQVASQEEMAEIRVGDQGIGIASHHHAQIFDRFYRVDTSLTQEVGGLGLGLTLCKSIIEMHGGSIRVESQEGQGSVFSLTLPVAGPPTLSRVNIEKTPPSFST